MKILVEFESLREFFQYMKPLEDDAPTVRDEEPAITVVVPEEAPEPEEPAPMPEPVKEEEPAPETVKAYALADAQKAVREVVKTKGKEVAKEILSRFPNKDKENGSATGASALRPQDYAAAIKALEEALNG